MCLHLLRHIERYGITICVLIDETYVWLKYLTETDTFLLLRYTHLSPQRSDNRTKAV